LLALNQRGRNQRSQRYSFSNTTFPAQIETIEADFFDSGRVMLGCGDEMPNFIQKRHNDQLDNHIKFLVSEAAYECIDNRTCARYGFAA
jgi:hypothetical protein